MVNGAKRATLLEPSSGQLFWTSESLRDVLLPILDKQPIILSQLYHVLPYKDRINIPEIGNVFGLSLKDTLEICSYPKITNKPCISMVWYELTTRCNLTCIHCYANSSPKQAELYDTTLINDEDMLHQIADLNISAIQFIGGEPLLERNRLIALCDKATQLFKRVTVFTNGTLLDEDIMRYFADQSICVALSYYSCDSNIHDRIVRKTGAHACVEKNLQRLKELGVSTRVAVVIMAENTTSIYDTEKHIKQSYGFPCSIDYVRKVGRGVNLKYNDDIVPRKHISLKRFSRPINFKNACFSSRYHNCFGRRLYIASTGIVYPCVMERRYNIGSVFQHRLSDILSSRRWYDICGLNKDNIIVCKTCEFRYYCFDCRPNQTTINSNINAQPKNCDYNPTTGQWTTDLP